MISQSTMIQQSDNCLPLYEDIGGTYGGKYLYIRICDSGNCRLVHVGRLREELNINVEEQILHKNRKSVFKKYCIKAEDLSNVTIYEFNYSGSGNGPYVFKYELRQGELKRVPADVGELCGNGGRYLAKLFGIEEGSQEYALVERYLKYVPAMVEEAKRILPGIWASGPRLENLIEDAECKGLLDALVQPDWHSRKGALESLIREAHEVYVLAHTISALGNQQRPMRLVKAYEIPTAVVKGNSADYTVWYQFPIEPPIELVIKGMRESMTENSSKNRQREHRHIIPDIVVAKGNYKSPREIDETCMMMIDAKIDISDKDVKQLTAYKNLLSGRFQNSQITYVVAVLEEAGEFREKLERIGYVVVEDVRPGGEGIKSLEKVVKEKLSKCRL